MSKYPNTRVGWHNYYVKRYNKSKHLDALQLACWYLLLHLAFGT